MKSSPQARPSTLIHRSLPQDNMMPDEDLFLDDAYAFLLQQTRLQQQHRHHHHHHHKAHNIISSNKFSMKQSKSGGSKGQYLKTVQSASRMHNTSSGGFDVDADRNNNAAMANAAAALSLCALDGSHLQHQHEHQQQHQHLFLQNLPTTASLPKLPPRIIKLLYIDPELDEKEASVKLEEVTSVLYEQHEGSLICSFTVIANCMTALETTEHVDYDAIFVAEGKNQTVNLINKRGSNGSSKSSNASSSSDISAYDVLRILRMVGSTMPIILLTSLHDLTYSNSIYKTTNPGLPPIGFETCTDRFAAVLPRPYRSKDICHIVSQIIASNTCESAGVITGDSFSEMEDLISKSRSEPVAKAQRTSSSSSSSLPAMSYHRTSSVSTSSSSVFMGKM